MGLSCDMPLEVIREDCGVVVSSKMEVLGDILL